MQILILSLVILLCGCSRSHPYDGDLHCSNGKAYEIQNNLGDMVWLRPTPMADVQCKDKKNETNDPRL
jgi:hypothetical protein